MYEWYDEATLARLNPPPRRSPRLPAAGVSGWRRSATTSAVLAAVAMGLREVFDPPVEEPVVEEVDVSTLWRGDRPVVFHYVPGAPARSRAIVRPRLVED